MYAGFLDKLDIRDIGEQFHSPNFHFHPFCLQRFSSLQLSSEWAFVCCLYKARLSHHNQSLSTQILEDPAIVPVPSVTHGHLNTPPLALNPFPVSVHREMSCVEKHIYRLVLYLE